MAGKRLRATLINITHPEGLKAKVGVTAAVSRGFQADVVVFHRRPTSRDIDDYLSFIQSVSHSTIHKVVNGFRKGQEVDNH